MEQTGKGIAYPTPDHPFPPGLGGVGADGAGGAFRVMAESIDAALTNRTTEIIGTYSNASVENTSAFTDIPPDYETLILYWAGRTNAAVTSPVSFCMRFNGDGGAASYWGFRCAINAGATAPTTPGAPTFSNGSSLGTASVLSCGLVSNQASSGVVYIPRYHRGLGRRDAYGWGHARQGTGEVHGDVLIHQGAGAWNNNSVITSVRFWPSGEDWAPFMRATLVGVPRAEVA